MLGKKVPGRQLYVRKRSVWTTALCIGKAVAGRQL
jgi:hypothetical protein